MATYQPIIGMEVHVELKTKSKMFCACKNDPDEPAPNKHICAICLGHPGALPTANRQAIAWTVLIGKALGCTIRNVSKFDRKHYFYPDLPKGYQISQYDEPIAEQGSLTLHFFTESNIRDEAIIEIERVHLEEDTAKLTHVMRHPERAERVDGSLQSMRGDTTLVDFNRSSTPLVEIVTRPDFKTALEAKTFCQELRTLLRYLGVSDADMEKGHMRCEANVSMQEAGRFDIVDGVVKPLGNHTLNHKVEVKNINSFKAVEKAIAFEIDRQTTMLDAGETWVQQTRGWDENNNETVLQRTKENAQDYRYFPEPDIPPFHPETIAGTLSLPELPAAKRARFHEEYGFSYADAKLLSDTKAWATFAEQVMSEVVEWLHALPEVKGESDEIKEKKKQHIARLTGGWMTSKLMGLLSERNLSIDALNMSAENFAELVALIYTERVNSTSAQKILTEMVDAETDVDPSHLMEEKGYGQIRDDAAIAKIVETVIREYPKQVGEYKAGKESVMKFLVGMGMKASEGSADPKMVEGALKERLSS